MSEMGTGGSTDGAFRPATVGALAAVGILAFLAMLVLGAYAPDLQSGRNGGSHALSNAATGFSGIVRLAEATGRHPAIVRNEAMFDGEALLVATPESGAADLGKLIEARGGKATLIVLPKWNTMPDKLHPGWVRAVGLTFPFDPERTLAPAHPMKIDRHRSAGTPLVTVPDYAPKDLRFLAPGALQTVSGKDLKPIVTDPQGRIVVGEFGDSHLYVLSDPDLLSNHGMADVRNAGAALALLDFLNATNAHSVLFDVTLNGLGRSKSPLKLLFDPPFLAATLALFAAALLAGFHGLVRFGAARRPERALAFGKAALVDNAAALVRKARRQGRLGARYAELVRERAAAAFGAPATLQGAALDTYLDGLGGPSRFTPLAEAAAEAGSSADVLAAARALHEWEGRH